VQLPLKRVSILFSFFFSFAFFSSFTSLLGQVFDRVSLYGGASYNSIFVDKPGRRQRIAGKEVSEADGQDIGDGR
jgi:hypothetical protein